MRKFCPTEAVMGPNGLWTEVSDWIGQSDPILPSDWQPVTPQSPHLIVVSGLSRVGTGSGTE